LVSKEKELNYELVIIGAGAAGMAAAIFAAESKGDSKLNILLVDSAKKHGAKILVSGGGRCNVTHGHVSPTDYNGTSSNILRRVMKNFSVQDTVQWMDRLGVALKLEPTGKYFPQSNQAKTVLTALQNRLKQLGVEVRTGCRVRNIAPSPDGGFVLQTEADQLHTPKVIVATGGLALPKSGSDGAGLNWMRNLGLKVVPTTPALCPLILKEGSEPGGQFVSLSGLALEVRMVLSAPSGKKLAESTGAALWTHFGLSGPAPMDISRHLARYRLENPGQEPILSLGHPRFQDLSQADQWLLEMIQKFPRRQAATVIEELFPSRWAQVIAGSDLPLAQLNKVQRREIARNLSALPLPVVGDRGYTFAETTAGGVDLSEVNPKTMESRKYPGLYLCGEILDVDGRIGGFNFQWAWASGYLAGKAAGEGKKV
jgi:predicted Rossmann fold flavoprotein